jgi:multiple sugar transport system permease protein
VKPLVAYVLLLPALFGFLLCGFLPVVGVGYLSFFRSDLLHDDVFVGLRNYWTTLTEGHWLWALRASTFYAITTVILHTSGGLFLAFLAYHAGGKWMSTSRFLYFLPTFTAGLIIAQAWRALLHPMGWAVTLMGRVGLDFWRSPLAVMSTITLSHFTANVGGQAVFYLSILLGAGQELKDAARVDGASEFTISRHVLLPMISTAAIVMSVMQFIGAFQMWETPRFLSNGTPDGKSSTLMFDVWRTAFVQNDYGLASAKTIIMAVVIATGIGIARVIQKAGSRGS